MKKMHYDKKDFTVGYLDDREQKGKLNLSPEYQRDYVYTVEQASKLIESALMNIPLPIIYFCDEGNGTYSVIDGQQRITSFLKFKRNEFALAKLTIFPELNGKFYRDLDDELKDRIDETVLITIIIDYDSAEAKYDIFERLNRGAVKLQEQELRNCVYRGPYNDMINGLALDKNVQKMFISENKRMFYQEQILRFFALGDYFGYTSNMKKQLNNYMKVHQKDDEGSIQSDKELFKRTLSLVIQVMGDDAFCTVDYDKKIVLKKFSPTFYDSIMIAFSKFDRNKIISHADAIREKINKAKLNDDKYHIACYAATGSRDRVITRIHFICDILFSVLGNEGLNKEARAFDPAWKEPLAKRQHWICPLCGNKILDLEECEIDHIDPYSCGGETNIQNAQVVHTICNRHKSNNVSTDIDSIIGRPTDNQKVVFLNEDADLTFMRPDCLIFKNKYKKADRWLKLACAFVDLLKEIDYEKFEELADRPYKLTNRSKPYIDRTKDNMYGPYEVIPGVFVETNLPAYKQFEFMKALAVEFGLDPATIGITLKAEDEE